MPNLYACVSCGRELECYKNEAYAEISSGYVCGDVYQCPSCGYQVFIRTSVSVVSDIPPFQHPFSVTSRRKPGDLAITARQMLDVARRVYPEAHNVVYGQTVREGKRFVRLFKIIDDSMDEIAIARLNDKGEVVLHPIR